MREYVLRTFGPEPDDARERDVSGEFRFEADDFVAAIAEARSFHDEDIDTADVAELSDDDLNPIQTWKLGIAQGI